MSLLEDELAQLYAAPVSRSGHGVAATPLTRPYEIAPDAEKTGAVPVSS